MNLATKLETAGFRLRISDGQLQVWPVDRLSDVQRDWLRRHKGAVTLALLARDDPGLRLLIETFGISETVTIAPAPTPPLIAPPCSIAPARLKPEQVEQALATLHRLYHEHEARLTEAGVNPRSALVHGADYAKALRQARIPVAAIEELLDAGLIHRRGPYLIPDKEAAA